MLGPQNVTHVPLDALGGEFRLHEMMGKLANIASDMKRMDKMEEGRLKELVSGEPLQVNRKFKSPMTMVPTAQADLRLQRAAADQRPLGRHLAAHDCHAFQPPVQRSGARSGPSGQLMAELPGIFNWALAGAMRLFEQGGFTRCQVCDHCAGEHRQHSDSFLEFVDEMAETGADKRVLVNDFYRAYVAVLRTERPAAPKATPRSASRSCGSLASPRRGKRQAAASTSTTESGFDWRMQTYL